MNELIAVMRAANFAAKRHTHQRRKGAAQEPYINHLLEVASLVTEATNGTEPNVTIAALLHDTIEDQNVSADAIASEFGHDAPVLFWKSATTRRFRKRSASADRLSPRRRKADKAKLIKLADKTSNLRAVANSPAADWSVERRLEYVEWAKSVVAGIRGTSPWLEKQFDVAAEQAMQSVQ
jgi:(p)ppGpp synthase/HD superfamily hydrolase